MKTPTNNLYQLIQSMTAAEKRYFKIHFSSSKSLVTKLFDYINTMSEYDEEQVKENFKDSKLSKNLKVYKIMLMDLLLKSLSSFRYKKNLNSTIRQSIDEVEILIEKKLYTDSHKRLVKVKEVCQKFEEWNFLLIILDLEFQLKVFHGFNFPSTSEKQDILNASKKVSKKIKTINELRQVNFQLSGIANQLMTKKPNQVQLKEFEKLLLEQQQTLEQKDIAPDFKTKYYLNSALSNLYHSSQEIDKEYHFKKSLLSLFDDHPHFKENNPEQYWAAYYNFINCCSRCGKEEELLLSIEELKKFTETVPEFQRKMTLIYLVEIHHMYGKNKFKFIEDKLEPLAMEHIKTLSDSQSRGVTRTHILLALVSLATDNQTKVQFYLRRLFESSKKMDEAYSYYFEVINFISHYEAKDFEILRTLLSSRKRKMKRNQNYGSPFFKEIVLFFSSLMEANENKQSLVQDFKSKLASFENDSLYILMDHFILKNWIKALENGKSYAEQINSTELLSNGV